MNKTFLKIITFIFGIPILFRNIVINLVFNPIEYFKNRRFKRKHFDFLRMNNGRNFFCYKNKKSAENYIKKNIESNLSERVNFVNLNDNNIASEYKSSDLKILKNNDVFPCLLKIRNENLIKKPMYNEFYKALFINKSNEDLMKEINTFFELN